VKPVFSSQTLRSSPEMEFTDLQHCSGAIIVLCF
jgi:hypothetical protein